MDSLAPELLDTIFTFACTDGGFTGCSLSAVSKNIRATSRAARFHSISLDGSPVQMKQFLCCFLRERTVTATRTPTVRHLYFVIMKNEKRWLGAVDSEDPEDQHELRRIEEETTEYIANVTTLLQLVSQNLESLCFVQDHGWMWLIKLPAIESPAGGFPLLRELTLVGPDPFVTTDTALRQPIYPRLTHLHLGFPTHFPWKLSFDGWVQRAPKISHLYLSEVNGAPPALEDLAHAPQLKFQNLRHLLMRTIGPPVGLRCGDPLQHYQEMVEALQLFCEAAAVHAEVILNSKGSREWVVTAKEEWLDRLSGGNGCWVMSETAGTGHDAATESTPRVRLEWNACLNSVRERRAAAITALFASWGSDSTQDEEL